MQRLTLRVGEVLTIVAVDRDPHPLLHSQWELLEKCERSLYQGEHGAHSYTSVNVNEGHALLNEMWDYATTSAESTIEDDDRAALEREAARRVSAAMAVLAFGREFLLK